MMRPTSEADASLGMPARSVEIVGRDGSRRVAVVGVHYYERYLLGAMDAVLDLAARVEACVVVLVSNRADLMPLLRERARAITRRQVVIVPHDNVGQEFGAYQAGLDRALEFDPQWVVFANDTLTVHSCFSSVQRKRLLRPLRGAPMSEPHAVGEVEMTHRSFAVEGKRTHRWLTTHIFALNSAALDLLGRRLHVPELDALVVGAADPQAFFSPRLDPVLADHLLRWLFDDSGSHAWYAAAPLTAANCARFAAKARAILQEKYIAARLEDGATYFVDIKPLGRREQLVYRLECMMFDLAAPLRPAHVA
jgi:hypothetical protein